MFCGIYHEISRWQFKSFFQLGSWRGARCGVYPVVQCFRNREGNFIFVHKNKISLIREEGSSVLNDSSISTSHLLGCPRT